MLVPCTWELVSRDQLSSYYICDYPIPCTLYPWLYGKGDSFAAPKQTDAFINFGDLTLPTLHSSYTRGVVETELVQLFPNISRRGLKLNLWYVDDLAGLRR